ncbi:MAG: arginine--tRNA ligase [bacterium]
MESKIRNLIKDALLNLKIEINDIVLTHPEDFENGDYSTNVALAIAKNISENPKALAEKIVREILRLNVAKNIHKVEVAGAGFINFYLSRKFFTDSIEEILNKGENVGKNDTNKGEKIMVEYTDPNPFKPFHIGHLMTNAIGESIARILEHSGADVSRANYQGDIGLHVAKAIYGLLQDESLQNKMLSNNLQAMNIGKAYSNGAEAYETNENGKKEIDEINKKLYARSDKKINEIYHWGFDVTMDAFEDIYTMLGTKFKFYFLESVMADFGREIVNKNMGKVFEESDGAVVFKAEKHDPKLHTRVFITSQGLPTYETKELGLTQEKFKTNPNMDLSITVTATEQMDYMRVVMKALSLIHPELENRMKHITHGMMRFVGGKMSSRKGNVVTGESLLADARGAIMEKIKDRDIPLSEKEQIATDVGVSAIKYSILRQSIGADIIYDFEKSISFEGDSGPYLQYSFARANSILEKAHAENILPDFEKTPEEVFEIEKLLYRFPEVVLRSASLYEPHHIASYLIEIARSFNSFYGNTLVVNKDDENSPYKVALTYAFAFIMRTGIQLLGIKTPEKM